MKKMTTATLILVMALGIGLVTVLADEGDEGLTPGYWKRHLDDWAPTGYSPDVPFDVIFKVDPTISLLESLNLKGGGIDALSRHAVAAVLNAAHPDVDYPLTEGQVIAIVQAVDLADPDSVEAAKDELEELNELGCPDD